jgi:hypothetical protein
MTAIGRFIDAWNNRCTPFTWTKDPATVIAKATHSRNRKEQQTSDTASEMLREAIINNSEPTNGNAACRPLRG